MQALIEKTVTAMGYALVDVERAPRGLLRVTIDHAAGRGPITVDDCEKVTRQLQYALEVEGADYSRLEVGSPGVDRPLKSQADFARFAGERVRLVLREPMPGAGGRKKYEGVLQPPRADGRHAIVCEGKDGLFELEFDLHEVQEARLHPELNFKPKSARDVGAEKNAS
jgi:ribosome maturation factor RimP